MERHETKDLLHLCSEAKLALVYDKHALINSLSIRPGTKYNGVFRHETPATDLSFIASVFF